MDNLPIEKCISLTPVVLDRACSTSSTLGTYEADAMRKTRSKKLRQMPRTRHTRVRIVHHIKFSTPLEQLENDWILPQRMYHRTDVLRERSVGIGRHLVL